ncbi:hypothetical protein K439DRAFT_1649015 [Ramaria rubella]|nr:hypothetical protein K439DRAFT_1649015 [Ramaria rubella]
MFPTLFPYGIGGFDDPSRSTPISFQSQASYYLDTDDRTFRYHNSFLFVVLNIIQRRMAHLHMYFTHEGSYADLSAEQKQALDLLKHVNTVAARIFGSQASKIQVRNEIRNYIGLFGLPHIYLTMNPNPVHSPIFQVMFGDTDIDMTSQFPQLVPSSERSLRLAKDPVAAADFFHFSIDMFLKHMMGWNRKDCLSKPCGGLFGRLHSYYGTTECTE